MWDVTLSCEVSVSEKPPNATFSKDVQSAVTQSVKLHAYTLLRISRFNTRIKDLVDMLLLILQGAVRERLNKVFHRGKTKGAFGTCLKEERMGCKIPLQRVSFYLLDECPSLSP